MLTGLRASDAATLIRLCGVDQKAFLRVGNLLQGKLSLTESALADLLSTDAGKAVLLDRRLRDSDGTGLAALISEHHCAADVTLVAESDGWRVIALQDEIGNPLLAAMQPGADIAPSQAMAVRVAQMSPTIRAPVEGLLAASGDDQRAAALEQLRYASPPLEVVGELMPLLLADTSELVRERAIGLLVASGAHVAVIDLVRALQRDDLAQLARLGPVLATLPPMQRDLACAALIAVVGRGLAVQPMVDCCTHLAEHLSRHHALDRLLELLLPTTCTLVDLVRALQSHDPERLHTILSRSLGQSVDSDKQVLILLAGPGQVGDERLIERGLDLLLSADAKPLDRLPLAGALVRLDSQRTLGRRIAARGAAVARAYDTSVYWLLGDLARAGLIAEGDGALLSGLLRRLLREASGPHIAAILEYQLASAIPAPAAEQEALVEPLAETLVRFRDERTRDLVLATILALGQRAIAPLWRLLEDHPQATVHALAAGALPELLATSDAATAATAAARLLSRARHTEPGNDAARERRCVMTAAARLATIPALDGDPAPTTAVDAACRGNDDGAIDALGYIGASRHVDPVRRAEILEWMLAGVLEELPDSPLTSTTDKATLDVTFLIDDHLGRHTERVPMLLQSLLRMGRSPHLPPPLVRRLAERLCDQWKRVSTFQIVWGPGNVQELGAVLGLLAREPLLPVAVKVRICEALLPRIGQLPVARTLALVFAGVEGYLTDLAGRSCARLLALVARNEFADDEDDELADTLVDWLAVPDLGDETAPLQRRLVSLITARKSRLNQKARVRLRGILPKLTEDLQQRLEWV